MVSDVLMTRAELRCRERSIPPDDVTVRAIPLPPEVHGFVLVDPDGHYNVYVRAQDPLWRQYRALEHELDHVASGDVYSDTPLEILEHLRS